MASNPPQQQCNRNGESIKQALAHVAVPSTLLEGVAVLRVKVDGSMRESFLTLSQDRFTVYITSSKVVIPAPASRSKPGVLALFNRAPRHHQMVEDTETAVDLEERSIDIGAIDRIQRGQVTHKFELAKQSRQGSRRNLLSLHREDDILKPSQSFSIIFRGARTLDLMMVPGADRDYILDALDNVLAAYQRAKVRVAKDVLLLRYIWLDVDKSKTNTLTVPELAKVLARINFQIKEKELKKMFDRFTNIMELDKSQRKQGLNFSLCCTFLHKINRDSWLVKPVNVIWNELFGEVMNNGKPRKTVSDISFLEKFLHAKQGEKNMTLQNVHQLFDRLHQMELSHEQELTERTRISKDQFEAYLSSDENNAFDPGREKYDPRLMNKPISEYWINSSHNTYLTGDQFKSHSSVEMYMNALYRGCRCLELDVWDGDLAADGRPVPVVWHGHTMTTKILFVDILQCFRVFLNFHPDTYPLVLSFENHCSIPFQEVMAEDLVNVLGDILYIPTEASLFGRLPSPEDMRGLVVIKGRRPDGSVDDMESDDDSDDDDLVSNTGSEKTGQTGTSDRTGQTGTTRSSQTTSATSKISTKISPALARLTLFHGCKHNNWDKSVRNPTNHMHSFSENKVRKMCKQSKGRKWAIYNQSHMTRIYPAGSRVDSSNYNPMLAWSTGCQLVALNFQTPDAPLKINDGRFRENGNCGYVLKPSSLMMKDDFSPSSMPVKLSIRILSGSCLPKPKGARSGDCIDPYVKVFVYDIKNEEKETCTVYQTGVVQKNGYTPIWASKSDVFNFIIESGAVAMLHIEVHDKGDLVGQSDEFIADSAIPISCLRQGYRKVELFDTNNTRTGPFDFASLLIEVKLRKVAGEI